MLVVALQWLLWVLVALFFVAWLVCAARFIAFRRLRSRLMRAEINPQRRQEMIASGQVRVVAVFVAAAGTFAAAMLLMGTLRALTGAE